MRIRTLALQTSAFFRQLPVHRTWRRLRTMRSYTFLAGSLAGIAALTGCHLFLGNFGSPLPAVTALALALAAGVEWGWKPPSVWSSDRSRELKRHAALQLALAAWLIALPWGFQLAMQLAGRIPLEVMAAPARVFIFQTAVAFTLLTPAIFLIARLPQSLDALSPTSDDGEVSAESPRPSATGSPTEPAERMILLRPFARAWAWRRNRRANRVVPPLKQVLLPRFLTGFAAGLTFDLIVLAPLIGASNAGLLAAFAATAAFFVCLFVAGTEPRVAPVQGGNTPVRAEPDGRRRSSRLVRWGNGVWLSVAVAVVGALTATLMRMTHQLAATAGYLVYLQWIVLVLGASFGVKYRRNDGGGVFAGCLCAAAAATFGLLIYPWLIDASLWVNAFVVAPSMLMLARCLLLALLLAPIGYGWGRIAASALTASPSTDESSADDASPFARVAGFQTFAFVAGFLLVRWIAFDHWPPADLIVGLSWALIVLAALRIRRWSFRVPFDLRSAVRSPKSAVRAALAFAAVLLVGFSPAFRSHYDPMTAARRLFSTNVFLSRMNGSDSELLSYLDEGRPVAMRECEQGTFTLWRYRGSQLEIRENGVPKALVSTQPRVCPQFSAEVMPAAWPLILHERPHRMMILGASGGVSLTTALSFPVKSITLVESDARLLDLLEHRVWSESRDEPQRDDRLSIVAIDPALAVACRSESYDVIVSTPDQSALLRSSPYFTRGFYRRVSARLAAGGIFCQRFSHVDYGPMPLQTTAKTLQSVFRNVVAIEIAAGEVAFLATNSPDGLVREGLVERFQTQHVRTALGRIGWDWSLPLNLKAYSHEGLQTIVAASPTGVNTAANGRFAFRLPQEVMRWAPKHQELAKTVLPHGTRFLESEGIDGNDPDLLRRLSELAGQQKLMTQFPDQWWAYRKSLKEQLRDRPRTIVGRDQFGKTRNQIHPEDRRRLRYFRDLDRAARNPSPEPIHTLLSYAEPYDPLLSYFTHSEIASLYERSSKKDLRAEIWHRLHAIYYSHPNDRSVRDVARTLELLAGSASTTATSIERWDHLNALLQIMRSRWDNRGLVEPKSARVVLFDLEQSIAAIESAFKTMDALHPDVNMPEYDWSARRRVIERGLLRPLSAYRASLLKHHSRERKRTRQLLEQMEEERRQEEEEGRKVDSPEPKGGSPKKQGDSPTPTPTSPVAQ